MYARQFFLIIMVLALTACSDRTQETIISKLNIGIVSYEAGSNSLVKSNDLKNYLGTQLSSVIEIEPAFNEVKALEQISQKRWDLVFAPPGLAAIAINDYNYEPVMSLEGRDNNRSVIVVESNAPFQARQDLGGQVIALGQKGSATGYYFPLYNLYGLKFTEVLFSPTPQAVLQLLQDDKASVGALSLAEYNLYRQDFSPNQFKILYVDKHNVPSGAILVSDRIERNQQEQIRMALSKAPSFISSSAGYLPTEKLPDYSYMTKVIKRIQTVLKESPLMLQ